MAAEITIPSVGESVKEAVLAEWFKEDGAMVTQGEPLLVIETDKVTLEVEAAASGRLQIKVAAGETVAVGAVVGAIDTEAAAKSDDATPEDKAAAAKEEKAERAPAPEAAEAQKPAPAKRPERPAAAEAAPASEAAPAETAAAPKSVAAPSVRRLAAQRGLDLEQVPGTGPGGRITKGDVILHLEASPAASRGAGPPAEAAAHPGEQITRKPMSPIRQRIAERLLAAKQNTAMLTTFNEIDMHSVMAMRGRWRERFKEKYGVSLGFMSFFIKASVEALKEFAELNAYIDGKEIVYHDYCHIGIAVGAERGLVVPVIRHAEQCSFAELEQAIVDFVDKIRNNRLELSDLEGGTFTITNGGVYGSLLSTPILNSPQSGILGMHKIEKRPVVIDEEVVVRPMMYVALSYDHRIVDGKQAVTFLRRIKEYIENPERIMMEI
jgi:2-oxoglutarate dehydrogenase E2 component (dihydrolipoamide succinyltransferase)